jgi:hypothetical protein
MMLPNILEPEKCQDRSPLIWMIWHLTRGPTFANDGRNQRDFMMRGMSISHFCLVASSLARVSFGDTREAKLLDGAIVDLLDRKRCSRRCAPARQRAEDVRVDGGLRLEAKPWVTSSSFHSKPAKSRIS